MIFLFKTTITYILWIITSVPFTLICIPFALLPEKIRYHNRFYFFLTNSWNRLLVFFTWIKVEIKGKSNLPKFPQQPSIIIANHASSLDIFLIESILGSCPRLWLSKDCYGKIPLFNILVKKMHVPVNRQNPKQAIRALFKAYEIAKLGPKHILLFPEGTRYSDGKIHSFLPGFAILAKKLKYPVIPIAIQGTNIIFPKKRLLIDSKTENAKLIVGQPLFYKDQETTKEFVARTEKWFKNIFQN